jgi:hypothetical protein
MKRLEYARRIRSAPGRARNTAEAVMFLAAVARERHRLEQEKRSLERRITRIDARLGVLADTETKLVPAIQLAAAPAGPATAATPRPAAPPPLPPPVRAALPLGVTEVTLQY